MADGVRLLNSFLHSKSKRTAGVKTQHSEWVKNICYISNRQKINEYADNPTNYKRTKQRKNESLKQTHFSCIIYDLHINKRRLVGQNKETRRRGENVDEERSRCMRLGNG